MRETWEQIIVLEESKGGSRSIIADCSETNGLGGGA